MCKENGTHYNMSHFAGLYNFTLSRARFACLITIPSVEGSEVSKTEVIRACEIYLAIFTFVAIISLALLAL